MRYAGRFAPLVLVVASAAGPAWAQPSERSDKADEAAAVAFARANHPELADLLARLKSADKAAYRKAVRDVSQARDRIERLKDPEQHDLALRVWTLDSRIRLLAAKLTMGGDAALEAELRDLLTQRRQARLDMLRLERARLVARLEKLDAQAAQLEADPAAAVDREFDRLTREARATRAARDGKAKAGKAKAGETKPAEKKPAETKPAEKRK